MTKTPKRDVALLVTGLLLLSLAGASCSRESKGPVVDSKARGVLREASTAALSIADSLEAISANGVAGPGSDAGSVGTSLNKGDSRDASVLFDALQTTEFPEGVVITAMDEQGVSEVFRDGAVVDGAVRGRVTYIQVNNGRSSVCIRLSADGSRAQTNSNDPVEGGPYNEYVAPLDGVAGTGYAIVGYAMGSATQHPQDGIQNACDTVPMLKRQGDEWVVGSPTDSW